MHELQRHTKSCFITLTYNDQNVPSHGVSVRDLQLFFKRLRKALDPVRIRYYASAEYGEKFNRPHYHCIIFGIDKDDPRIDHSWQLGFIHKGNVSAQSCRYTAKYIQKKLDPYEAGHLENLKLSPLFALMSRNPGIGSDQADVCIHNWLGKGFCVINGTKQPIPKYYLSKVTDQDIERYKALRRKKGVIGKTKLQNRAYKHKVKIMTDDEIKQVELNINTQSGMRSTKL